MLRINLNIIGTEVELDKTIIEGLNDPLTHMIRNSIDHGIETPEIRIANGKPQEGNIGLKAYHEAGQVIIEISDDGQGLNLDKIVSKAISNGILTSEESENMNAKDKMNLIFSPGLSTAEKITDVSGRGVGMDVVKSKIDNLGGGVSIHSYEGKGSTFRIKLPLTLAIIPSLLVESSGERFAIPQINIVELINIPGSEIKNKIQKIGWADVLDLRGELIPLVILSESLGMAKTFSDHDSGEEKEDRRQSLAERRTIKDITEIATSTNQHSRESEDRRDSSCQPDINVVIVSAGLFKYGLIVDELDDNLEIVVKPLGSHICTRKEYAGATIMGDGRVALIIDVSGIAQVQNIQEIHGIGGTSLDNDEAIDSEVKSYLSFKNSMNENCAIPMQLVTRVEHIEASRLEIVGGRRVMQYRGKSLPVVALEDVTNARPVNEDQQLSVIITDVYDREIGLIAVRPIDSLEVDIQIDQQTLKQKGILGSAVIEDKTTLVVDVFGVIEHVITDLAPTIPENQEELKNNLILLAEDSSFFRNQIKSFLNESGYETIDAVDGRQAWEILDSLQELPALIVTDIEMPRLDGYGFTKKIRGDHRFADIPVFAVTSLASESNRQKGKDVGITEYHVKLEKESLLKSINNILRGADNE